MSFLKLIFVPEEFGDRVEVIVLPVKEEKKISAESKATIKFQEKTGFATQVLADEKEDIWNEL